MFVGDLLNTLESYHVACGLACSACRDECETPTSSESHLIMISPRLWLHSTGPSNFPYLFIEFGLKWYRCYSQKPESTSFVIVVPRLHTNVDQATVHRTLIGPCPSDFSSSLQSAGTKYPWKNSKVRFPLRQRDLISSESPLRLVRQRAHPSTPQPPPFIPHMRQILRFRLPRPLVASALRRHRHRCVPARQLHALTHRSEPEGS